MSAAVSIAQRSTQDSASQPMSSGSKGISSRSDHLSVKIRSPISLPSSNQSGLTYFEDFFELSGNWPEWLRLFVVAP